MSNDLDSAVQKWVQDRAEAAEKLAAEKGWAEATAFVFRSSEEFVREFSERFTSVGRAVPEVKSPPTLSGPNQWVAMTLMGRP